MATVPTAGERPQSLCADVAGYDQEAEVCDVIILLNICYAVGGKLIVVLSSVIGLLWLITLIAYITRKYHIQIAHPKH